MPTNWFAASPGRLSQTLEQASLFGGNSSLREEALPRLVHFAQEFHLRRRTVLTPGNPMK